MTKAQPVAPRPSAFVGSSSEGLPFARAVRARLQQDVEIKLWNEGFFEPGKTTIEKLAEVSQFDFAVLVLTGDDPTTSRSAEFAAPRDNVIFELGLFVGRLGRERTFIVHLPSVDLKMPPDLLGVTTASLDWPRADESHDSAVGTACDTIRNSMAKVGKTGPAPSVLDTSGITESDGVVTTTLGSCEIRVVTGRIEDQPTRSDSVVVLPCNEYFDDLCARDTKSALGSYVNKVLEQQPGDQLRTWPLCASR